MLGQSLLNTCQVFVLFFQILYVQVVIFLFFNYFYISAKTSCLSMQVCFILMVAKKFFLFYCLVVQDWHLLSTFPLYV